MDEEHHILSRSWIKFISQKRKGHSALTIPITFQHHTTASTTTLMDDLKKSLSNALHHLISSERIHPPISSLALLGHIIALGASKPEYANFRLTDLHKLEACLEELGETWEAGSLDIIKDDGGLSVMRVKLDSAGTDKQIKKRKRPVDEDADSAEEEAAEASIAAHQRISPPTALSNLSKQVQEIYALLQRGTTKKKLMADQVSTHCYFQLTTD